MMGSTSLIKHTEIRSLKTWCIKLRLEYYYQTVFLLENIIKTVYNYKFQHSLIRPTAFMSWNVF